MSLNGLGTTWPYLPLLTVSGSALIISQAGDAIVDLSGTGGSGGNPATWSQYPATQQVELGTQNLNDVGVLQCADSYSQNLFIGSPITLSTNVGTALSDLFTGLGDTQTRLDQVQSGVWTYDPSGGPGTWYQYDAVTLSISTVLAPLQLGAQAWYESVIPLVDSGVPVYLIVSQGALSQRFTITGTDMDPGVKYLLFTSATAAPAWVTGQPTQFSAYTVNTDSAPQWATFPAVQNINANGFSLTGASAVSASGDITAFSASGSPITMSGLRTRTQFRDSTEFFVSNNGSDVSGDGSMLNPYATIQKAITQAELISSAANICVINVASGHYTENLTFTKGYVMLNGVLSTQTANEVTEITGSITISCAGAPDLFNRQVVFQGFNITCGVGQTITDNSTTSHSVAFQDCKIFTNGRTFNGISTGADARTYFTNCDISQTNAATTDPTIYVGLGAVEMERVDITTDGNCPSLEIGGTATLYRLTLSTLENTANTTAPICRISSSSTTIHSIGQNAFNYSNTTLKGAGAAGIYISSGVGTTIVLIGNTFTLAGTSSSVHFVVGYNGVNTPVISGINNTCPYIPPLTSYANSIQTGITKLRWWDVSPMNSGAYSSTLNQTNTSVGNSIQCSINTTESPAGAGGITLAANRLYPTNTGTFQLTYTATFTNTGADADVYFWMNLNGTRVGRSAARQTVANNHTETVTKTLTFNITAGQYVDFYWLCSSANVSLATTAAGGAGLQPATPSFYASIVQVA